MQQETSELLDKLGAAGTSNLRLYCWLR